MSLKNNGPLEYYRGSFLRLSTLSSQRAGYICLQRLALLSEDNDYTFLQRLGCICFKDNGYDMFTAFSLIF